MKKINLEKYLNKQKKIIEEAKWLEGEKRKCDPGEQFVLDWIKKNGKLFRKKYCIEDLNEAIKELDAITLKPKQNGELIEKLQEIKEKLEETAELLETENDQK
jgi:hypothetical protein